MFTTLINAETLNKILNDENIVVIDCRFSLADTENGQREYERAHIPGAVYAHLDRDLSAPIIKGKTGRHPFPDAAIFSEKLSNWSIDSTTQVIAYDQSHGGIAARLWFLLKWLGHEKVAVLNGGWKKWQTAGFSVTNKVIPKTTKVFVPRPQSKMLVDINFMEQNIDNPKIIYIDSRAAKRYSGEEEPIDPVAGHIPGAVSAPFLGNLDPDGLFLKKEALARRFIEILRGKPKAEAIFYCGSGVTACHNLLAMHHLGLKSPRLFSGSWSEWIVNEKRPIATEKGEDTNNL